MIKIAFPEAWEEVALVAISRFPGTLEWRYGTIASPDDLEMGEPDYPGEGRPNLAGGRIWKQSPQEDGEFTLKITPIELDAANAANNKGLFQQFAGGTYITSEPLTDDTTWAAGIDRTRDRFRVCVLWTNDPAATIASIATAASTDSLRFTALGCRIISHKTTFTDGIVETMVTFKYPAMNKLGTVRMFRWESGDQTALVTQGTYDDEDAYA